MCEPHSYGPKCSVLCNSTEPAPDELVCLARGPSVCSTVLHCDCSLYYLALKLFCSGGVNDMPSSSALEKLGYCMLARMDLHKQ